MSTSPQAVYDRNAALAESLAAMEKLAAKPRLNPQEKRQFQLASQRVAALRAGYDPKTVFRGQLNKLEREHGLRVTQFGPESLTAEQRSEARAWKEFCTTGALETRDETVEPSAYVNLNGNMGSFIPIAFMNRVVRTMAQHSPLFDEENVSYMRTTHGRPVQTPWASDIENVASVLAEATQDTTETDIKAVSGALVQTFAYRTPKIRLSYEAVQDLEGFWNLQAFLEDFMADRLARGAGADLLHGNGVGKPFGLIGSLIANAASSVIVAVGSSANTGGTETGSTSIGTGDLKNLYFSIPAPYRQSPKFGWIMNSRTLGVLSDLKEKNGRPILDILETRTLYGKPVLIDEGMDDIGNSAIPIIAGDLSYWLTRVAIGDFYIRRYTQAPALVEKGEFAVALFARVGGQLMFDDQNAPSPIWRLVNHS